MTREELELLRGMMREEIGVAVQPISQQLNQLQERFDGLEQKVDRLEQRVGRLEQKVDAMQEDIAQIREDAEITRGAVNALGEWAENVAVITAVTYPVKKAR